MFGKGSQQIRSLHRQKTRGAAPGRHAEPKTRPSDIYRKLNAFPPALRFCIMPCQGNLILASLQICVGKGVEVSAGCPRPHPSLLSSRLIGRGVRQQLTDGGRAPIVGAGRWVLQEEARRVGVHGCVCREGRRNREKSGAGSAKGLMKEAASWLKRPPISTPSMTARRQQRPVLRNSGTFLLCVCEPGPGRLHCIDRCSAEVRHCW